MEELKKEEDKKIEVKDSKEEAKPETVAAPVASKPKAKANGLVYGLSLAVVILAASTGYLGWQYFKKTDSNKQQQAQITVLQGQLKDIRDQLVDFEDLFGDIGATATPTPTTTPVAGTISETLEENVAAAIDTMNTAALEGYMADSVYVLYAATEYAGDRTPAQAVADLDYLANAIGAWDFDLPQATKDAYEAGSYADYFGNDCIVGQSSDDYVVSFRVDANGHIDQVFISASADLLL